MAANTEQTSEASRNLKSKTGLRPCPFCGSASLTLVTHRVGDGNLPLLISCSDCGSSGPLGKTEVELRVLWDTRAASI